MVQPSQNTQSPVEIFSPPTNMYKISHSLTVAGCVLCVNVKPDNLFSHGVYASLSIQASICFQQLFKCFIPTFIYALFHIIEPVTHQYILARSFCLYTAMCVPLTHISQLTEVLQTVAQQGLSVVLITWTLHPQYYNHSCMIAVCVTQSGNAIP